MKLRPLTSADLDDLYRISLATGDAGGDASHLYADARLMGHIYAAPYGVLLPAYGLVVEEGTAVAGFAVGAPDTRAWEGRLEAAWWPSLRARYPAPDPTHARAWSADERRIAMIHNPGTVPVEVVKAFPAHMHLNLLPRVQRRGVGPKLYERWIARAFDRGVRSVHVGVNRLNATALRFWRARGFETIDVAERQESRTVWLGQHL